MFDEKKTLMLDMGKNCHIIKGVSNNETKVWFMYSSKNSAAHPPTAPKKACFHQKIRYNSSSTEFWHSYPTYF